MSHYYQIDTSVTTVPYNSYLEITASTVQNYNGCQFFYCSPNVNDYALVKLCLGAQGKEEVILCSSQKQAIPFQVFIEQGSRITIQSIANDITSGYVILCLTE